MFFFLVNFLKVFYKASLKVNLSLHLASHTTLHDLIAMEGETANLVIGDDMIETESHTSKVLNDMAQSMKNKI